MVRDPLAVVAVVLVVRVLPTRTRLLQRCAVQTRRASERDSVNRRQAKRIAYGIAADAVYAITDQTGQEFSFHTDDLGYDGDDLDRIASALLEIHDQLARYGGLPPATPLPVDPNQVPLFEAGVTDDA